MTTLTVLPSGVDGARDAPSDTRRDDRRLTRPPMYLALAFLVVVFNLLGLVMVMSASTVVALDQHGSSWHIVSRQALWAAVGGIVMLVVARVDYHRWRRYTTPLLVGSVLMLVLVLVPGLGTEVNGATRWLGTGTLSVQPSELVKLTLVLWIADLLARRRHRMRNTLATLRPTMVVLAVIATLVMLQPNLGTTIILVAIALALAFVAGAPLGRLAAWSVAGITAAALASTVVPYRRARVFAFVDPWADPLNTGYQNLQSFVGLASGGLGGTGLGTSRAKWGFLPFAHNDFIYAIIGEELGMVGAVMVVGLFGLLGIIGIRIALHAPDRFGMLVVTGVTVWLLVQAFVNIGVVIGLLPIAGVPLPFVSAGGSSLVFAMAAVGLMLSVARQAGRRADAAA